MSTHTQFCFKSVLMAMFVTVAALLSACGSGSSSTEADAATPAAATPTATPATDTSTSTTPTKKVTNPNPSPYYYYDDAGQWHLQPGVTPGQALDAGVLCKVPTDDGTRNAYLAAGRTLEWIAANIYSLALCPGY